MKHRAGIGQSERHVCVRLPATQMVEEPGKVRAGTPARGAGNPGRCRMKE